MAAENGRTGGNGTPNPPGKPNEEALAFLLMGHPHPRYRTFMLLRLARCAAARWAAVVVLVPLLAVGVLRGGVLVAHSHADREVHLHLYSNQGRGVCLTESDTHACHEHPGEGGTTPADEPDDRSATCEPGHLSVSVSVPDQTVPPSADAEVVAGTPADLACEAACAPAIAKALQAGGPPSGVPFALPPPPSPPPTALARLLRSSCALLL